MRSMILLVVFSLALVAASVWYLGRRYPDPEDMGPGERLKTHWRYGVLTCLLFLGLAGFQGYAFLDLQPEGLETSLLWTAILWGVYLLACTDVKERLIPNQVVLALLVLRLVFLLYELWRNFTEWKLVLLYPAIGAAIGGGILMVVSLISKQGVGMGDIKMFMTIGLYVGSRAIFPTLFYTVVASAVAGLFLLIFRKAKLRDSVPMAPFALIGVTVEYVFLMIGG